jgi:DNA-binding IclR family transcriptional regulator
MAMDYRPVKSAERTIRLLEVLAAAPTRLSLTDLQERMGYPRSSLYALVRTLRELGWIEADSTGTKFSIGPDALRSGSAYLEHDPAIPYAARTLEELSAHVGNTVHYGRRDGTWVFYLATRETTDTVQCAYRVGRKRPLYLTALGQALLAELTTDELNSLIPPKLEPVTDRTIVDRADLHTELEAVRERGWAFEYEQGAPGVACVAATVDYRIPATDAISCSMSIATADDHAELHRIADHVVTHARRLGEHLRRAGIR